MKSLLLTVDQWDLCADAQGSIAACTNPYAIAQDAACACRLFQGELFYDTSKGIPYWATTFGYAPPLSLVKAQLISACLTVPGVVAAQCFISSFRDRVITGQVQLRDSSGQLVASSF